MTFGASILMILVKAVIIFAVGFLTFRIMGKRAVAEMSAFDMVMVVVLGTIYAAPLSTTSILSTVIAGLSLTGTYLLFSYLMLNNKIRRTVMAQPTVLIHKGNINENGMKQARITIPELLSELRTHGLTAVSDVEFAIMEEVGKISVIPKSSERPVRPSDLMLATKPEELRTPVIVEGEIMDDNLVLAGYSRNWLDQQLKMQGLGIDQLDCITLAEVDGIGTLKIDRNEMTLGIDPGGQQFTSAKQAQQGTMKPPQPPQMESQVTKDALRNMEKTSNEPKKQPLQHKY
ncbi:DUF421 domain-containing protein [Fodinisporobacter ferrooxydans]|uniref:DUF421 domain-containing protein n=1 Tax=Fodinisporobacter ferrooxydans TaxID=2901836 RepID=A0ABY4CHU7_9BACL|nr:DUF421 domain-containing protein [Alicyclobacillaceae bacterium MYW30-H2]